MFRLRSARSMGNVSKRMTTAGNFSITGSQPNLTYSNSTNSTVGKLQISRTLTLVPSPDKNLNKQGNNPLVLFFPWLGSTTNAVQRYCDIYHQKGWDVLQVNTTAKHFLWPRNAEVVAQEVLDYLISSSVQDERSDFLVHAMSVGAFVYTVVFIEMQKNPEKYELFWHKLRAQVFDSIVIGGLKRMGKGIAKSVTSNPIGSLSIQGVVATYLALTKKYTTEYYEYTVDYFKEKPLTVPTLLYYSLNDEMSDPNAMENLIGTWRAKHPSMDVTYKCWPNSVHAGHLKLHRSEYLAELSRFLTKIELEDDAERAEVSRL